MMKQKLKIVSLLLLIFLSILYKKFVFISTVKPALKDTSINTSLSIKGTSI